MLVALITELDQSNQSYHFLRPVRCLNVHQRALEHVQYNTLTITIRLTLTHVTQYRGVHRDRDRTILYAEHWCQLSR